MLKERSYLPLFSGTAIPDQTYSGVQVNLSPNTYGVCSEVLKPLMTSAFYSTPRLKTRADYLPSTSVKESFYSTSFKPPRWNDCIHFKQNARFSLPYAFIMNGVVAPPRSLYHMQNNRIAWRTLLHNPLTIAGGVEVDQFFRSRAMATMTPRFESDFKALNFLYELKDFKQATRLTLDVLNPWFPLWGAIKKWSRRWANAERPVPRKRGDGKEGKIDRTLTAGAAYASGATSAAANSWLTYTMAYLPTMKDLAALGAALATEYDTALQEFKEKGLSKNTRHYSEVLMDGSIVYPDSVPTIYNPDYGRRFVNYVKATANVQYSYKYTLSDPATAFMKYWGLTGTAEEFWNAIPFSFLVDYFLQISKALQQVERDKNLILEPVQYCESLLGKTGTEVVMRANSYTCCCMIDGKLIDDTRWRPLNGVYSSNYKRDVMPVPMIGLIVPRMKLPSLRQQANIVALARTLLF